MPEEPGKISRRKLLGNMALMLGVVPVLGACTGGFRPLYGPTASGGALDVRLAQVTFSPIPGRVGQQIRNELIFQSTGGGNAAPPTHRMDIAVRESVTSTLVDITGDAASQVYNLDASFRLIDLKTQQIVFKGDSHSRASFERFQAIYANVRAKEDAQTRAARTVASDIKTRLAAYMSSAT